MSIDAGSCETHDAIERALLREEHAMQGTEQSWVDLQYRSVGDL